RLRSSAAYKWNVTYRLIFSSIFIWFVPSLGGMTRFSLIIHKYDNDKTNQYTRVLDYILTKPPVAQFYSIPAVLDLPVTIVIPVAMPREGDMKPWLPPLQHLPIWKGAPPSYGCEIMWLYLRDKKNYAVCTCQAIVSFDRTRVDPAASPFDPACPHRLLPRCISTEVATSGWRQNRVGNMVSGKLPAPARNFVTGSRIGEGRERLGNAE
ncbi:hypothetical protein BDZ91DRAFT_811434, partial [Kalaharituber pfeilii]